MPVLTVDEDVAITYTVRELLAEIKSEQTKGFARLEANLESKADKTDVSVLATRVEQHTGKIGRLEERWDQYELTESINVHNADTAWNWRRRTWAAVGAVAMVLVTFWGPYIAVHLHF